MRKLLLAAVSAAAVAAVSPAYAQTTDTQSLDQPSLQQGTSPETQQQDATQGAQQQDMTQSGELGQLSAQPGHGMRASSLMGATVYSSNDEAMGSITNLIVSQSGDLLGAVIGVGGFLGTEDKDVLVPMDRLQITTEQDEVKVVLDASREELEQAPAFDPARLGEAAPAAPAQPDEQTTEAPTAEEPETGEQVTEAPETGELGAEQQMTEAPTAEEPATGEQMTEAPATGELGTEQQTTEAPTAEEPATGEQMTEAPTAEEPATGEQVTEAPETGELGTEQQTTEAPTAEEPATGEQVTEAPETGELGAEQQTTEAPTAEEPATGGQVTEAPETAEEPAQIGSIPDAGGQQLMASDLIGQTLYSQGDESIGDINDVVFSDDGQVLAVLVGIGGFLGIGERQVAIPMERIEMVRDEAGDVRLMARATREEIEAAPAWEEDAQPTTGEQQ